MNSTRRVIVGVAVLVLALVFAEAEALAQSWTADKGVVLEGTIITLDGSDRVIEDGLVFVKGDKIVAVAAPGESLPPEAAAAPVVQTDGVIVPGLINAHSHTQYNTMPLWDVPTRYSNRYQWTNPDDYQSDINNPKTCLTKNTYLDLDLEVGKYAEVKEILGGGTGIQGSPSVSGIQDVLVRNVEARNFGSDRVYQHALSIDDGRFQSGLETGIKKAIREGRVGAFLIHLAEGVDAASRNEFQTLKRLGLLIPQTVVIHGTALTSADFSEMAAVGAKLVWSPLSNRLLYGQTTDVRAADRAGVLICLGSDWSPSGSKNALGELNIADLINRNELGSYFSDKELVKMATLNAAIALGFDGKVGRIQAGYYADIAIFDRVAADPYRSVINATELNLRLCLVGGEPLAGDDAVLSALKGSDRETVFSVGTRRKAVDVTKAGVPKGTQRYADFASTLDAAMDFQTSWLDDHWVGAVPSGFTSFQAYLDDLFPEGLGPTRLDPVYAGSDTAFFDGIRTNANALFAYDLRSYWTSYVTPGTKKGDVTISAGLQMPIYDRPSASGAVLARIGRGSVVVIRGEITVSGTRWFSVSRRSTTTGDHVTGYAMARYVRPR